VLRREYIGASLQQARWQLGRHLHQRRRRLQMGVGQQGVGNVAANQQAQGVAVLENLALILGHIDPR